MSSSKKKKYNCRFPPARIKKIMQADEEVGKVAAVVPLIISRALELFVESLLTESSKITRSRNARTLTPSHLKACITSNTQFSFLRDFVSTIPDIQTTVDDEQSDGNSTSGPSFNQGSSSSTTTITTCTMPLLGSSVSSKTISRPHRTTASNSFTRASNRGRGRPRKINVASARSQDDEDGEDEDDDDDDEDENDVNESKRSENKSNQVRPNDDDDDYETLDEEDDEGSSCDNSRSNTSKIQPTPPLLNQINSFTLALNQQVEDDDYDN